MQQLAASAPLLHSHFELRDVGLAKLVKSIKKCLSDHRRGKSAFSSPCLPEGHLDHVGLCLDEDLHHLGHVLYALQEPVLST